MTDLDSVSLATVAALAVGLEPKRRPARSKKNVVGVLESVPYVRRTATHARPVVSILWRRFRTPWPPDRTGH